MITEVKHVKNSCFMQLEDGDFSCIHYGTEILRVTDNGIIKGLNFYSLTSNRMIKRCLDYIFGQNRYDWENLKTKYR